MDVQFTDEQELLRETARDFLATECPMALVREQMAEPDGFAPGLWKQMAELGWVGLIVPEEHGGSGLSPLDLALLMGEMGRVLLPGPFLSTAVVGVRALLAGASDEQRPLLRAVAEGELRLALAQIEDGACWEPHGIRLAAESDSGGYRLTGRKLFVPDAGCADRLIVAARTEPGESEAGITLLMVDPNADGVRIRPIAYNEQIRKVYEVELEHVHVPGRNVLGAPGDGWAILEEVHAHARVALCAELAGAAQRVLEMTVDYARTREQFGQPIGRFQSIQHKCADMLIRTEGVKSAAYYAAWALANREADAHTTACLAKSYCTDAYSAIAADGIQIHGGLGFTWEQDPHLYYKHAQAAALSFGDATHNRELAARDLIGGRPWRR